jgi:hypothetical protein
MESLGLITGVLVVLAVTGLLSLIRNAVSVSREIAEDKLAAMRRDVRIDHNKSKIKQQTKAKAMGTVPSDEELDGLIYGVRD